ncbi:MAG: hypothetical protein IJ197_01690 [Bacteroidaceae bacterium]|nr:hypothetical protein [Bacteroidaceae bacterium]
MTRQTRLGVVLCIAATTLLFSCIDESYDLDHIDKTIGTTADITLPLSSTGDILLKDLMSLEDDGIVQFITDENGNECFAIVQDGKADIEPIEIKEISVSPGLTDIDTHVDLSAFYPADEAAKHSGRRKVSINTGTLQFEVPDYYYEYEVTEEDNAKSTFTDAKADVNKDVRALEHITIKDNTAHLNVYVPELPDWLEYFYLENGRLYLPDEMEIASCVFTAYGEGSTVVKNTITEFGKDEARGLTIIPLTETNIKISAKRGVELDITFKGLSTGRHFVFTPNSASDGEQGTVTANGEFEVQGIFRFNTADVDEPLLNAYLAKNPSVAERIHEENSMHSIMPKEIDVHGTAEMRDIIVTNVTGTLQHDIAEIEPIRLEDMPDFLNDDDVVLDLENPVILLKAVSGLTADARTGLTLGSTVGTTRNTVTASNVVIQQGTNLYYMANSKPRFMPDEYKQAKPLDVTGNVASLIKKIPEEITVGVAPVTLEAKDFDVTKRYDLSVEYKIFAPLTIGEEFMMVYRDTERGWIEDLEDLDKLDVGKIELKGKVDSNMPAKITLTLIPLDENGQRISAIKVNSAQAPPNAKDYDITITLEPAPGHTLNDALAGKNGVNRLDGMTYEARINESIKGETIYKTAHIRIHDIKATVKGGITYDLNDDDDD